VPYQQHQDTEVRE